MRSSAGQSPGQCVGALGRTRAAAGRGPGQDGADRARERAAKRRAPAGGPAAACRRGAEARRPGERGPPPPAPSRAREGGGTKGGKEGERERGRQPRARAAGQDPAGPGGPGRSSPPAPAAQEHSRIIVPARSIFTGPRPHHRLTHSTSAPVGAGMGRGELRASLRFVPRRPLEDRFRPRISPGSAAQPRRRRRPPRPAALRSGSPLRRFLRPAARPRPRDATGGAGPQGTPRTHEPPRPTPPPHATRKGRGPGGKAFLAAGGAGRRGRRPLGCRPRARRKQPGRPRPAGPGRAAGSCVFSAATQGGARPREEPPRATSGSGVFPGAGGFPAEAGRSHRLPPP